MKMLPVGERALLLELDDADPAATYVHINRLVAEGRLMPARDLVPAARTVLVDGVDPEAWWSAFRAAGPVDRGAEDASRAHLITISVSYGGDDLDEVARQWSCDPADVVRRHQDAEFTVEFCGFAPGFAYCVSEPALPEVSRRDDPRTKVPSGAVGLAGPYCGIYPTQMPGGWQLIGSTAEVMFDPGRESPARLQPGDRIRFQAVG
jgi:KipI family sensor histidine kinase inhibitor